MARIRDFWDSPSYRQDEYTAGCHVCGDFYDRRVLHTCHFAVCAVCGMRFLPKDGHLCTGTTMATPRFSDAEVTLMKALKGEGFIITPTDSIPASLEEIDDIESAKEIATAALDRHGAVIIWAPVMVIRPKKDIVAKVTKFGRRFDKVLSAGDPAAEVEGKSE